MLGKISLYESGAGIHINAFTDGYAFDEWDLAYFLSIAGQDSAVKAISSGLINGRPIEIQAGNTIHELKKIYQESYRILTLKLPSGLLHQIVCHEDFFKISSRRKLIFIPESENDTFRTIFSKIQQFCPVPAIPEWSDYICSTLKDSGHLQFLKGNLTIVQLDIDEEFLDQIISEGVKSGKLKF